MSINFTTRANIDRVNPLLRRTPLGELSPLMNGGGMESCPGCQLSAGANALLLLQGTSCSIGSMMGQDVGLPLAANFGDFHGRAANLGPAQGAGLGQQHAIPAVAGKAPAAKQKPAGARVRPLAQSNGSSCGQTSAAMCINSLTGKHLTDRDINGRYGFALLGALNTESRGSGYKWTDAGDLSHKSWPSLEKRLNKDRTPVMIGLNGQFSKSGRGHIVTLLSIDGNKVTYADPADGKIKTTSKQAIENAPPHPQGKFLFVASKTR